MKSGKLHPQRFLKGEVHDWYRIILGYSDHLVSGLLDEFALPPRANVLDPFCGSGTTLVEGMKRGFSVTGLDANPSSCFAARVKTDWSLEPKALRESLLPLRREYKKQFESQDHERDSFYRYLAKEAYLGRWISARPARKIVALRRSIKALRTPQPYKDALLLALAAETVNGSSNVKFGPELYCGKPKRDAAVFPQFTARVMKMCNDLALVNGTKHGSASIIWGDARDCGAALGRHRRFDALISSPPYPTEHDYTRNSRLELALFDFVRDRESLRGIKLQMIRSHTKGVYKDDDDALLVAGHVVIENLAMEIDDRAASKKHGFARLYSRVLREYFGGLKRHFGSLLSVMEPGAMCAYVVGDQSSYLQVHIPTAKILAGLAVDSGLQHVSTRKWRIRWSTTMSRNITENILILRVPGQNQKRAGAIE